MKPTKTEITMVSIHTLQDVSQAGLRFATTIDERHFKDALMYHASLWYNPVTLRVYNPYSQQYICQLRKDLKV